MIKLYLLVLACIVVHSTTTAQTPEPQSPYTVTNPCEPCAQPQMDIVNYTLGGWPIETLSKQIKYGGCTYRVFYKKRKCDGFEDVRIEGIELDGPCANKPTDQGDKTDCEWLKSMQDMATSLISELIGTNPMGFSTNAWWHVFTPACFEFNGLNFISPIPIVPPGTPPTTPLCSKACCLHVLLVTPDSCGGVRMREVKPFNDGGCPNPDTTLKATIGCDINRKDGVTCIPICDRKLTEKNYGTSLYIPRWFK